MKKIKPLLQRIPIDRLKRGKYQPREHFDQVLLEELAQSIKSTGLLQPIVVRPIKGLDHYYEIIAGERRWRASQLAGLDEVDCLINHYTDEQAAEAAAIENLNRVNLDPIEEAKAYLNLVEKFNYTHEEVAAAVGKCRTKITNSLRLLTLDSYIQIAITQGYLSEGHGKILAGVSKPLQLALAKQAVQYAWSTRQLEQAAKKAKDRYQKPLNRREPDLVLLEKSLSDHIGCQVAIEYEQGKCQVKIDCHNLDILEGFLQKVGFKK